MGANRFASLRTEKVRRVIVPDRKKKISVGPQLCVSPTAGGRTGPRKGWGEEGKKKRKTYQKMIGEAKNIHSDEIQLFGILKTCKKRKKSEKGRGVV